MMLVDYFVTGISKEKAILCISVAIKKLMADYISCTILACA